MEGGAKLEAKFLKLGKELSSFPPENDLYAHLEEIDGLLSNVEQSPSQTMLNALQPLIKALAAKDFLRHPDTDVKVAVASCISEVTRITAPETPYDDDIMKEIFQMIVGSFAGLDNTSSRTYKRRVSVLETVAKVRSCVVMLDLECDDLILEMFHQFLKTIRDENCESLFPCMETIMSLVIEESEDVPIELLSVLLYTLKNDKEVLPIAQHLAERVLNNSASRIKPHLVNLVKTIGAPLNEYHKVVASICQENSSVLDKQEEPNDEVKVSTEQEQDAENVVTHASISNGSIQNGNGDVIECPSSPIQKYEHSLESEKLENSVSDNSGCDNLESNTKNSDDSEKYVQPVTSAEGSPKETGIPKVDENSTTIIERSVSIGTEKKREASIAVQAPTTELQPSNSLETEQQNVFTIATIQNDCKVSETNGNTDAVADPTASAYVQKESCSASHNRGDAADLKDDASESSKGDNLEAPTTVKTDYASKPQQSFRKRGRKGKKGRYLKGKSSVSAEKASVKKERNHQRGTPVKISPLNGNESENEPGNADDAEPSKSIVNKVGTVSRTIGKRGRPRKERAVEKGKDPADQVLQESIEKERDTSVEISPSKGGYSEKKPEITDNINAPNILVKESNMVSKSSGKRGRPRKKHATRKRKDPADKILPVKDDANVKVPSASENVEPPKNLNDEKTKRKTKGKRGKNKGKRGRPKKEDVVETDDVPLCEILSSGSNKSEPVHITKCKRSRSKVKDAVIKNKEPLDEDFSSKGNKTVVPESIEDTESPNGLTNDRHITPKGKGRKGRPKKANPMEKEHHRSSEVVSLKNGSAEVPENFETPLKTTELDVMSKTKGKRGRPRKELVTQESHIKSKPSAKKQKGEENLGTDVDSGLTLKETASLLKSASKAQSVDKANLDSGYEPRSRRKRAANTEDIYEISPKPKKKLDECLVGSKIEVWWPDDKKFYDGVVESYDRAEKKHTIVYTDGDIEVLNLKHEIWKYFGDSDISQTKKAKTDSTSKQAMPEEQANKSMVGPSSKGTPRPRGRPRKETSNPKSDILSDSSSPVTIKRQKRKPSVDEKATTTKILSKLKDVDDSPSSSGRSKAKKGTLGSGTRLKVTFSKGQAKTETESTPLVPDNESTEGRKRKDRK